MAAIFRPLRSSTEERPASLRATIAPRTAVATPVTLSGTPSSNAFAASAKLMSMASTFLAASWFKSGPGAPGTTEYSALHPCFPRRSSLWMISVAAQPSWRYARRTLPLPWAETAAGAAAAATLAAAPFKNSRRPTNTRSARDPRQVRERLVDLLGRVLVVLELAGEIRLVGGQIEEAVAGQVEHDRLPLAIGPASDSIVDGN